MPKQKDLPHHNNMQVIRAQKIKLSQPTSKLQRRLSASTEILTNFHLASTINRAKVLSTTNIKIQKKKIRMKTLFHQKSLYYLTKGELFMKIVVAVRT